MSEYPRPRLPVQPVLSAHDFLPSFSDKPQSIIDAPYVRYVTSGRMALALAIEHYGIDKIQCVLIPAYHCSSMVEPFVWANAKIVFYRINPDTSIDLNDISSKLGAMPDALLVTHYFGIPQNMRQIREYCDQNNLILIEDCAHAFYGKSCGQPFGYYSDYAIASIMKFFPVYDGGCLISYKHNLDSIPFDPTSIAFEIKSMINAMENAFEYNRLIFLKYTLGVLFKIKDMFWSFLKLRRGKNNIKNIGPNSSDGGYDFEGSWIHKRISLFSKIIFKNSLSYKEREKRLMNYHYLAGQFSGLTGVRLLFSGIGDGIYPYVLPIYVNNPVELFPKLKSDGVPIIRFGEFLWDSVDEHTCPISTEYSKHIFQIPVHQSLNKHDLDWIVDKFKTHIASL